MKHFLRLVRAGVFLAAMTGAVCAGELSKRSAQWIEQAGTDATTVQMPIFRHSFSLQQKPTKATVYFSGLGQGEVHLNGLKVGDAELAPAWTDYRKTVRYETYDVSGQLQIGENVIGVLVGNGMFNVVKTPKRYTKLTNSFGTPKIMVQIALSYADGTHAVIESDPTWKAAPGPIVFSSTYGGEDYDSTQEAKGWDSPGFDDSAWAAAGVSNDPGGELEPEIAPPIRVITTYAPVKATEVKAGVWVYDLGQNFAGWPAIQVSGTRGAVVKLTPGELLNADGSVSQRSSKGPTWFSFTLRGEGNETWHPRFSYFGFRYVQAEWTSGNGRIVSLEGQGVHSSAPPTGEFASSDEMLNRIHHLIVESMHSNTVSLFTDCPHREKLAWLEETHLVAPGLMFNNDLRGVYAATDRNMADAQKDDGMVPTTAPQYTVFGTKYGDFDDSPEWGSAAVLAPWYAYRFYGDVEELRRSYSMMQRYVSYLQGRAKDGIVAYGLGDWYDVGPGGPGLSKQTTMGVTATLMLYEDAVAMQKIAALLGKEDDVAQYVALAEREKIAFNARFFDSAKGYYDQGSQTAQAMPLALGIVPEARRGEVLSRLIMDIHTHQDHVTAGEIGFPYLVRALMEAGRSDVLLAMLHRTDPPSYGSQLGAGATALTEAWDANPNSSQDHFMLGHAEEWFYRGLAGIDFDMSRQKDRRITIRPALVSGINWAKASYESVLGKVSTQWRRDGSAITVTVEIPVNASGTIVLPSGTKALDKVSRAGAEFLVGAGTYRFVVNE